MLLNYTPKNDEDGKYYFMYTLWQYKNWKKNPELSQLFLPTTNWAHITSVTSDPIRASQRVFLFPLLPSLPSNFSMAATLSFKHTSGFCYSVSQWLLITFIMKPECPPTSSQAYIICSHILHLMLDSVLLAPSMAPHELSDDSLLWVSAALITLFLHSLAWTAWLFIYFSAQMVYPQRGFLQLPSKAVSSL